MKQKTILAISIVFFLILNTKYFWEGKLGLLAFLLISILFLVYIFLAIVLVIQIIKSIIEKFSNKNRLVIVTILIFVISLSFLYPNGLIDFERFQGKDLLVAKREGAANCMTIIKLKENNKFVERNVCFGIEEIQGNYNIKGDTVFFTNVDKNQYYQFAVIENSNFIRYKDANDTIKYDLWITKNLLKIKNKPACNRR